MSDAIKERERDLSIFLVKNGLTFKKLNVSTNSSVHFDDSICITARSSFSDLFETDYDITKECFKKIIKLLIGLNISHDFDRQHELSIEKNKVKSTLITMDRALANK